MIDLAAAAVAAYSYTSRDATCGPRARHLFIATVVVAAAPRPRSSGDVHEREPGRRAGGGMGGKIYKSYNRTLLVFTSDFCISSPMERIFFQQRLLT